MRKMRNIKGNYANPNLTKMLETAVLESISAESGESSESEDDDLVPRISSSSNITPTSGKQGSQRQSVISPQLSAMID